MDYSTVRMSAESVKRMNDNINGYARAETGRQDFAKYGALQADGTIIICDVVETFRDGVKKVRYPDGREKLITAADGYIPVVVD